MLATNADLLPVGRSGCLPRFASQNLDGRRKSRPKGTVIDVDCISTFVVFTKQTARKCPTSFGRWCFEPKQSLPARLNIRALLYCRLRDCRSHAANTCPNEATFQRLGDRDDRLRDENERLKRRLEAATVSSCPRVLRLASPKCFDESSTGLACCV